MHQTFFCVWLKFKFQRTWIITRKIMIYHHTILVFNCKSKTVNHRYLKHKLTTYIKTIFFLCVKP